MLIISTICHVVGSCAKLGQENVEETKKQRMLLPDLGDQKNRQNTL